MKTSDLLFKVFTNDNGELTACITPSEVFYGEDCLCDQFSGISQIEHLVTCCEESFFAPNNEEESKAGLRQKLLSLGLIEESDLTEFS